MDHGASLMILEKDLKADLLNESILSIIENKDIMQKMGEEAYKLADNSATDKIYSEISKLID